MDKTSLFKLTGMPDSFGVVLLSFSFILLLAPYFSGADFGLFKIPTFTLGAKRWLKIIGPVIFLSCVLSFIPVFTVNKESVANVPASSSTSPTPKEDSVMKTSSSPSPMPSPSLSPTPSASDVTIAPDVMSAATMIGKYQRNFARMLRGGDEAQKKEATEKLRLIYLDIAKGDKSGRFMHILAQIFKNNPSLRADMEKLEGAEADSESVAGEQILDILSSIFVAIDLQTRGDLVITLKDIFDNRI